MLFVFNRCATVWSMAEFENPFADPEGQNLFHVSSVIVNLLLSCDIVNC